MKVMKCIVVFVILALLAVPAAAKDRLVVIEEYDPTTLDPIGHDDLPTSRACHEIYDTLIFVDDSSNVTPGLAEKWEYLSPTELKFYLRKGVKFHNGDEMKASDVRFSFLRATTEEGAKIRNYAQNVKDVKVLDDYTVVMELKDQDSYFFASLAHGWASVTSEKAVKAAGDSYGMHPVGTGPFKFVSWQKGHKYVLERFDDFWGPKPKYKYLEVRAVPEPTSRTIALETGEADLVYPIPPNDVKRVSENKDLVLIRYPSNTVIYMGFNMTKPPLTDIRVRHAISAAIDVVAIQAAVFRGIGSAPTTITPPGIRYSLNDKLLPHKQDVELAKKLLAEAGVKDLKLEIWSNENKQRVDCATIVQAQLEEIGIKSEIRVLEWGTYLNGLMEKKHDLFFLGTIAQVAHPNQPISNLLESTSGGGNYTFTRDAKIDELLHKGRATPIDEAGEIYVELQEYINELTPMIYFQVNEFIGGAQKNVKGFDPRATGFNSYRKVYFE